MIYTVGGIKGGTGKTTIATNLAVWLGKKYKNVLLIDGDDQATATDFTLWRNENPKLQGDPGYTGVQLSGKAIYQQVRQMKEKYDHIVIDTGGRDTESQRAAMICSDIFLLPLQPRSLDFWTIQKVQKLLEEIRAQNPELIALAFLNRADIRSDDNRQASEVLQSTEGIIFLDTPIANRKSFSNAAGAGLSVIELEYPERIDRKACREINGLFTEILIYKPVTA